MKKKIFIIGSVFLLVVSLVMWAILSFGYSRGVRSGKLVKLSKRGFVIKTYEGTLDLGSGDQLTWNFSVRDDDLGEKLIMLSGQNVRLTYEEKLYPLFYNTKYDVISYDLVHDETAPDYFCDFVDLIKQDPTLVNSVRDHILKVNPDFIGHIRECSKN